MRRNIVVALFAVCVLAVALAGCRAGSSRPDGVSLEADRRQERLVVVLAKGSEATVLACERKGGQWVELFRAPGRIGRSGVSEQKREGDGATPAGVFAMRRAFGIAENPGSRLPYAVLRGDERWVDDPGSRHYNTWVTEDAPDKDWKSAENLAAQSVAYKYAVVMEYNTDPVTPGAGSAIFLHCSTDGPTAGCVSVAEADMVRLLRFIEPGDTIMVTASPEGLPWR